MKHGPKEMAQNYLEKCLVPLTRIKSKVGFCPSPVKLSFWRYKVFFQQQQYVFVHGVQKSENTSENASVLHSLLI